jgi:CheY-like chemotaxis protein
MRKRVLWIEDAAMLDLSYMFGPVFADGSYDLSIAMSAAEGLSQILTQEFHCVVVDIRLPPGDDHRWIDLYNESGHNKATARLGVVLAYCCLRPADARIRIDRVPSWVSPNRFGFLSVEPPEEMHQEVAPLGVRVYRKKSINDRQGLLSVIKEVLAA